MRLATLVLALLLSPASRAQAGAPDPSFGVDGVVRLAPGPLRTLQDVLVQSNGRILATGTLDGDVVVYRFTAEGAPDAAFGDAGRVQIDLGESEVGTAIVQRDDGRLVVSVVSNGGGGGGALLGLAEDGDADAAFGTDGVLAGAVGWADLALDAASRIVALGRDETVPEEAPVVVARFGPDGESDAAFGTGGSTRFLEGESSSPTQLALAPDGGIGVAGALLGSGFEASPFAARLDAQGGLDASFGTGGLVRPGTTFPVEAYIGIDFDAQGRLVTAGYAIDFATGTSQATATRFTLDGALDATFGTGGTLLLATGEALAQAASVLVQPDGEILVGGVAGEAEDAGVLTARLLPDGSLDPDFGAGGVSVLPSAPGEVEVGTSLALAPDGAIVLAGARLTNGVGDRALVARLLNDIVVADEARPASPALALAHAGANPSRDGRVRLALGAAEAVRLAVHDVRGRLVTVLHDGALGAGEHAFALGAVAPGVYLVRATSARAVAALPVAVAR